MDAEQKKKWEDKLKKIKKASAKKKSSSSSAGKNSNPDLNTIRKKYISTAEVDEGAKIKASEDLDLTPDPDVENDIEIDVKNTNLKAKPDNQEESNPDKKVVIKSKSKGILGSQG
ncbi:MAG TPA: hypothetical protein VEV87_08360 [Chitinophagaceae bacterium]|nr:hypothetical protein [Chitinophagaceae bacterium]